MAKNSAIEWTNHTLNFWWGCLKVSPGCENCYAETFSKRVGRKSWGPPQTTDRWRTKGPWRDVLKWDAAARAEGVRQRVFCQSMSDFFEDHPQVADWRAEACQILERLTNLDIQLLTKRPENIKRMVPAHWLTDWPAHIWIGTSVENQETADQRIPHLLAIPAMVHFLSIEPLLGSIDLLDVDGRELIDWVIVGGESGPKARPMDPDWVRGLREQCLSAGIPFFFKQWGEYGPVFNSYTTKSGSDMVRLGKKEAGRLLDGVEWSEFPTRTSVLRVASGQPSSGGQNEVMR